MTLESVPPKDAIREKNLRQSLDKTRARARVCHVHAIFESNYSRSLITFRFSFGRSFAPCRAINSHRFRSSLITERIRIPPFLRRLTRVRLFPWVPTCTGIPRACRDTFIFLPLWRDAAHLHGAISYVLRRPITRVDSGSDRKPSRGAVPNQTPRLSDVAVHVPFLLLLLLLAPSPLPLPHS